jgi:uncharacterized protein (TIGR03085 family)
MIRAVPRLSRPRSWPFTSVAESERAQLCDLLELLGPDAPTLCEGWTTYDMAAHLVTRERRPDAGPGLVIPALHGHTERLERQRRDRTAYDVLVTTLRAGPPLPMGLPVFRELTNVHEYFVHHEDVRRPNGQPPRPPDAERDRVLWQLLRIGGGRVLKRQAGLSVALERPDGERIGRVTADGVVVRGPVDELFLLPFRPSAVHVMIDGGAEAVRRFSDSLAMS